MKGGGGKKRADIHSASVVRVRLRGGGVVDAPFVVRVEVVVYVERELGTLGDDPAGWIVLVLPSLENFDPDLWCWRG